MVNYFSDLQEKVGTYTRKYAKHPCKAAVKMAFWNMKYLLKLITDTQITEKLKPEQNKTCKVAFKINLCKRQAKHYCYEAPIMIDSDLDGTIYIGGFSYTRASYMRDVKIGRYCCIAPNVVIGPSNHPTDKMFCSGALYHNNFENWEEIFDCKFKKINFTENKFTIIGNDVWIGQNAIIMSGVKIGNGAIIGAGAVVTKDVPDYAIYGGVPAKLIRYRFDKTTIEKLLKLEPWKYNLYDFENIDMENISVSIYSLEKLIENKKIVPYCGEIISK